MIKIIFVLIFFVTFRRDLLTLNSNVLKKIIFFGTLFFIYFSLIASNTDPQINIPRTYKEPATAKYDWVVYVPINNTFYLDGCSITINQTIAYVFNENLILTAIFVSAPWNIEINCGGPTYYYTRPASDITFNVSNNDISSVHFATTGIRNLDDVYSDANFKSDYLDYIKDNNPDPEP